LVAKIIIFFEIRKLSEELFAIWEIIATFAPSKGKLQGSHAKDKQNTSSTDSYHPRRCADRLSGGGDCAVWQRLAEWRQSDSATHGYGGMRLSVDGRLSGVLEDV
jgi:hypothetical protein